MIDATLNKKFFYINSLNRNTGTSSQFSISIQMPTHEQYDACVVTAATVPISYYLVSNNYNTFNLQENGQIVTITIPAGKYNLNSFCTVVPNLLNAASPNRWTYAMTYNTSFTQNNNGMINYTVTGNSSQPSFIFTAQNALNEQFGFSSGSTVTFTTGTLQSSNVVSFVNEQIIYIHSDIVSNNSDDILVELYGSNAAQLSVITYQCQDIVPLSKKFKGVNNQIMNVWLTDGHNIPINLNGQDIQFTLLCYKSNMFLDNVNIFMRYIKHYIQEKASQEQQHIELT
jgi:hypothetical protein